MFFQQLRALQDIYQQTGLTPPFDMQNLGGAESAPVLCCMCGTPIQYNPLAMCLNCMKSRVDITSGIPRQLTINFCKDCGRYCIPPSSWIAAEPESPQLLGVCLKRIPQLSKVTLVDARWIWTEPHSRRLRIQLTVRKEVFEGAVLEATFEVMFVVGTQQCGDCRRSYTEHQWRAIVQIRQHHMQHKRALFYLEQLILRRQRMGLFHATEAVEMPDGIDFFFATQSAAQSFATYVQTVLPVTIQHSDKLISADLVNNVANKKYTFIVECVPCWKDDLVILPTRLAKQRSVPRVQLVQRLRDTIHLINPFNGARTFVSCKEWQAFPFKSALSPKSLVHFTILDMSDPISTAGKAINVTATVCLTTDLEQGSAEMRTWDVDSCLGAYMHVGDIFEGYLLGLHTNALTVDGGLEENEIPPVVLARRFFTKRGHSKRRRFYLRKMKDALGEQYTVTDNVQMDRQLQDDMAEFEDFLNDLEDQPELRKDIDLFAAPDADNIDLDEEAGPQVRMDELLVLQG